MRKEVILAIAGFVIGAASLAGGDDESDLRDELERLQREAARAMQVGWDATGAAPADGRGNALAIFPVEDLTAPIPFVIPPSHDLEFSDSEYPLFASRAEESPQAFGTIEELVELVRVTVEPSGWEEGTITPTGFNLLVMNRPALLGKIRVFLDRTLRPRVHRGVSIDFEVVSVPAALSRQLRAAGSGGVGGKLSDSDRAALDAALAGGSARRVLGLRGNGLMGAQFLVWHGRQVAVLGDFDVEVAQTASTADPVVQIAQAGGYLSALAHATQDGKVISLALGLRIQELVGLRRHETRRSGNLDMPDLLTQDSRVSVKLAPGVWSIVASGTPRPGEHRLFLVRASTLERGGAR
jgi:hypothetical protein